MSEARATCPAPAPAAPPSTAVAPAPAVEPPPLKSGGSSGNLPVVPPKPAGLKSSGLSPSSGGSGSRSSTPTRAAARTEADKKAEEQRVKDEWLRKMRGEEERKSDPVKRVRGGAFSAGSDPDDSGENQAGKSPMRGARKGDSANKPTSDPEDDGRDMAARRKEVLGDDELASSESDVRPRRCS